LSKLIFFSEGIVTKVLKNRIHDMKAPQFTGIHAHEFTHIIGKLYDEEHKTKPEQPASPRASEKGQGNDLGGQEIRGHPLPSNPTADYHPRKPENPMTSIDAGHNNPAFDQTDPISDEEGKFYKLGLAGFCTKSSKNAHWIHHKRKQN
jgi:hypothetical protein